MSENGEKVFDYYLDLPSETRTAIIDEMEIVDRCRFTRCSKLSAKEAKASKNFIRGLSITAHDYLIRIDVYHGDSKRDIFDGGGYRDSIGYSLIFFGMMLECKTMDERLLWRDELHGIDINFYAAERYTQLLKLYQSKLQFVSFQGPLFFDILRHYDFKIDKFNHLKKLRIAGNMDFAKYLSKLRRPLEYFEFSWGRDYFESGAKCEQIYKVKKSVDFIRLKLNNEQFRRLSASIVRINIGYFTVEDIYRIIKSWQNGTIGKKVERYEWCEMWASKFDSPELFRRLGMRNADGQYGNIEFEIKHTTEAGKTAKLLHKGLTDSLSFIVKNDNGEYPKRTYLNF